MKTSEIKVKVKLKDVLNAPLMSAWERMCKKYGINEFNCNDARIINTTE